MNRTEILDIEFADASLPEAVEYALRLMAARSGEYIVAANTDFVHRYHGNKRFKYAVDSASLVLPEGNGVMLASQILGSQLSHRISAIDFCSALLARMSEKGMSLFVLGTDPDTVESACDNITARYPGIRLSGSEDGYYSNDEDIVDLINELSPDLVLVCHGSPRQEIWMKRYGASLNVGLMLGLGEGLKFYAGIKERAPKRWRDSGYEWFYWLVKHPERIFSMLKRLWIVFAALQRRFLGN